MGSYAADGFYRKAIDVFRAEKEWDSPRIIVNN